MPLNAATVAKRRAMIAKRKNRKAKAGSVKRERIAALPRIPKVILDLNYVNPVTLDFPKGVVVYEVKNRFTGRKNYYNKATFAAMPVLIIPKRSM